MENRKLRFFSIMFLVSILFCGLILIPLTESVRAETKVLKVWDIYRREADNKIIKAAIKKFKEGHPDVKFERLNRTQEDLKMQIMAALPKGKGPDLMTVNNGETIMGPLVRGGHLLPLDKYAKKYNWGEKILSPEIMNRARYTSDGTVFGKGNLYGVPFMGELVGVYYNKEIFNELNIDIPQSMEEFEKACTEIREAGYIPITYGGLDDWQFFHLYGEVLGSTLTHYMGADSAQDYLDDIVLRWDEDRTFVRKGTKKAAKILQDWVKENYFVKGFSGLKGDDAFPIFTSGKAAMFIQGSWYAGGITESDIKAGFFPFPSFEKEEGLPPQVGGMLTPYGISKYTEHPDLAADFINTVVTAETTEKYLIEKNSLPASIPVDLSRFDKNTLKYDLYKTWNKVNNTNRMGHYLDWISSSMWDTMGEAGRKLMNLKITPEEFVKMIQEDYEKWQGNKPAAN